MDLQSPLLSTIQWDQIRYSQVWEDAEQLRSCLQITPQDQVLSIGSAGCNVLEMLLQNPARIDVVDLSPAQHALLDLRFSAIRNFDFNSYLNIMGFEKSLDALSLYRFLRDSLLPSTTEYFDQNLNLIVSGLCHQGRLEKYFQTFREQALNKFWSADFIKRLTECETLESQTHLLQSEGRTHELESLAMAYFDRQGLEKARDPGQMKFVNTQENLGRRLFENFQKILFCQVVKKNPYLFYFITGKIPAEQNRLPSLQARNFQILKSNLHKVHLHLTDIESLISKMPDESLHKMNLSNIFEYLSEEHCEKMFALLAKKLAKEGRISYWTLFVDRKPKNANLERQADTTANDRLWIYQKFSTYQKT